MSLFKVKRLCIFCGLQVALFLTPAVAEEMQYDVVCFGDSITKRGYPELMAEQLDVAVFNAGVPGHSSGQGLRRFEKDVLAKKPQLAVVFFGTNDIRVDAPRVYVDLAGYRKNLTEMVTRCLQAGIQVVICTPPPIREEVYYERHKKEDFAPFGGVLGLLADYAAEVKKIAEAYDLPLVDLHSDLVGRDWMHPDGVHPSKKGCEVIAELVGAQVGDVLGACAE